MALAEFLRDKLGIQNQARGARWLPALPSAVAAAGNNIQWWALPTPSAHTFRA